MKYFSHLNTATKLIQQYRGQEPFHHFLKNFFSQYKKFGSKDRKRISHLCYSFFRVGHAFGGTFSLTDIDSIQHVILAGLFLCGNEPDELLGVMKPLWNNMITAAIDEKATVVNNDNRVIQFNPHNIFPPDLPLSDTIDEQAFNLSHVHQPDLFIRIRPGYKDAVIQKLQKHGIKYELPADSAVRLPNGIRTDALFEIDKEAVVQDLSSQRVGVVLNDCRLSFDKSSRGNMSVWDCCAASGGKSIMAKDILGNIDLTVSDIRTSILINLQKRFEKAGLTKFNTTVADLSHSNSSLNIHHSPFDLIIADLPCTGSGTWGRTPEQLSFFEQSSVDKYSQLQKRILVNVMPHLKQTGLLLYITCSVFKKENEEIVDFLRERFSMKIEKMELLKGYDKKADTLFAALLSRL